MSGSPPPAAVSAGGTSASPTSRPSAGTSPDRYPEQTVQSRAWRASLLRQRAEGTPFHCAAMSSSRMQRGRAASARTTSLAASNCAFMRWTRTAVCCGDSSRAPATSARVSSPAVSSHHSDSSARSSSSSQRVASAASRRCPVRPRRTMVRSTKSAPGSTTSYASSRRSAGTFPDPCARQCPRISFIVMATNHERKLSGRRSEGRLRSMRSALSWTMSSTSAWPLRARPTML